MKMPFLLLFFITIFISVTCTTKEGEVMNFEPSLGSIFVSSTTPGARIFLDYKDTGKLTPDLLNNIKKGEHIVHIFLSNYVSSPDSFRVTVEEGKETTVTFEVTNVPNVGNLVVNTDPDSALVKINKLEFGYSPLLVSGLLQGKYRIRIEKSGFAAIDTSAVVIQNQVAQISATLTLDLKRLVLFEHFSNTDCVPCVGVDEIFEEVLDSLGPEFVTRIGYHPNVPSASDPFYQEAKVENNTRKQYYSVPFSPYAVLDGTIFQITSLSQLKQDLLDALNARAAVAPPGLIMEFVNFSQNVDTLSGSVKIWALENIAPNTKLRIALINRTVDTQSPPGINGQTHFFDVLRRFSPGPEGHLVQLNSGQKTSFPFHFVRKPDWPDNLVVVAFLQNDNTKEVLQSIWTASR